MTTKILKNSLKPADGGRVEVTLISNNQPLQGFIEQTFFEDAFGAQQTNPQQKIHFTTENLDYLEAQFRQQVERGILQPVIR